MSRKGQNAFFLNFFHPGCYEWRVQIENLFISQAFALIVGGLLILYYLPILRRAQVALLLVSSLFIYWLVAGNLIFILVASSVITGVCSYQAYHKDHKKRWMVAGVALNLSLLAFFKYKKLFVPPMVFEGWFGADPSLRLVYELMLPVGISFYVFHGISLIVDSYRREALGIEKGLGKHMAKSFHYITFFPQIVSGPIVRGKMFFPQIAPKYMRDVPWKEAIRTLITGYFLKEVIANNLHQLTVGMNVVEKWEHYSSLHMFMMMIGFSAQIFADFAGYSLIAIGIALLFGYRLPENFRRPYFATSFTDFWQRWHITLSTWLRDYLYRPLGGSFHGLARTIRNIFIVMFLGGLWHGAEWKFALWGMLHASCIAGEHVVRYLARDKGGVVVSFTYLWHMVRVPFVFMVVTVLWLFFQLDSVEQVVGYLQNIAAQRLGSDMLQVWMLMFFSSLVLLYHYVSVLRERSTIIMRIEPFMLGIMLALCLFARGRSTPFIYFQF